MSVSIIVPTFNRRRFETLLEHNINSQTYYNIREIINLDEVFHGVATEMEVVSNDAIIFKDIPTKFDAARYHSWLASDEGFPDELTVTARDEDGGIQAIEHKSHSISAVQFHPESILTEVGEQIVRNFIEANS